MHERTKRVHALMLRVSPQAQHAHRRRDASNLDTLQHPFVRVTTLHGRVLCRHSVSVSEPITIRGGVSTYRRPPHASVPNHGHRPVDLPGRDSAPQRLARDVNGEEVRIPRDIARRI